MPTILERLFVWAGGAIFVGSLVFTAWVYTIKFGIDRSPTGWSSIAINALLLTVFATHHSVFAREPIKTRLASLIPTRLLRSVYVWVASILLVLTCYLWQPVGGIIFHVKGWPVWIFTIVRIAGFWIAALAVKAIDPLELAGIRNPKLTNDELQTHGVYGFVRHPLYFGWVLIVFSAAHMTGDRFTFAALTSAYLMIGTLWEERSLERAYGQAYRLYKQAVRWRIVPYLY